MRLKIGNTRLLLAQFSQTARLYHVKSTHFGDWRTCRSILCRTNNAAIADAQAEIEGRKAR